MKINKPVAGLLALSVSAMVHGGAMGPIVTEGDKNIIILSGGATWPTGVNGAHSLYFSPELSRTYTLDKATTALGEGTLFVGRQHSFNSRVEGQLGILFAAASRLKISGSIWDFDDLRFNNYRYSYTVQPNRIAIGGKLLETTNSLYKPWVNASIGVSVNRATNYQVIPTECEAIVLPQSNLSSHSTTSFSYSIGAGIQRIVTPNVQVGLGYEFTDWGKNQLAAAPAQPANQKGLMLNHFYTNGLLLNVTWLR
ncbi:porin family protein [uncultured Legionella sp.]|uniref:porin family protein n=1 Tax=uncultured Legionella sp. TaxID=210934 RepID=UPI002637E328|nr:porin family protein [uncultured Legionella sp.]